MVIGVQVKRSGTALLPGYEFILYMLLILVALA
jgi:hypothetical protein